MQIDATEPLARRRLARGTAVVAITLVAFPVILFYAVLFQTALDLPFYDDYLSALDFTNQLTQLHSFSAKASFFLAAQLNEYKLPFEKAIIWLQFCLYGHVNFAVLSAIGNSFVLLLGVMLWKMFLPTHKDLGSRLAMFIPVSWLLFQFEYHELLNWGCAALQHISVLVFAFASIYLLFRTTRQAFYGAGACFLLAVASSGNGFLLFPIGLSVLAMRRRYRRILAWLIACTACIAAYSYHYNVMSSRSSPDHSILSAILRLQPAYVVSFMGNAASIPFPLASFFLGIALCFFFAWMAYRGYGRRNPAVSCCVLFMLLTAIGVAGIRSDLGLGQSLSSRYTIYSALFLIFAWFAIVEEFVQHSRTPLLRNDLYLGGVAAAMLFSLFMDAVGLAQIKYSSSQLVQGMSAFEHPNQPGSTEGPDIPSWKGHPNLEAFNPIARAILLESIRLGVYRPPALEPASANETTVR